MSDIFLSKRVLKKKLAYVFSTWGVMSPIRKSINEAIEKSVAADVAPVAHGEWVYDEFDIPHCSECGHEVMPNLISPFCPNCGAKMDGEELQNNE